ncbi:MAG: hypothetical protein HC872_03815 [Gammaproteobacteria bacterium]|nr:hypothetical protein [Gammaproteobacteria bacterium]
MLGGPNPHLVAGAEALRRQQYLEGIELTLTGLQSQNAPRDHAAALSNLCAGYAALKQFDLALKACDDSLNIDRRNWRTWNNRAAAHLGQGRYDAALGDVQSGLEVAPHSTTLRQTQAIIEAHKRSVNLQDHKAIKA